MLNKITDRYLHFNIIRHLLRWTILCIPLAFVTGSLVACFLWLLDSVTALRYQKGWLIYGLPLAGIFIHFLYKLSGKNAEAGNNLIIDEIHEPGGGVPARMTPLVLSTTIVTHLFGGSAGREGTAVQMGGSMAGLLSRWFKLSRRDTTVFLMCGIAAGFGAVFGTPVSGAIFALEVLAIGRISHNAILPCFMAAILGDVTCSAYGIHHTQYSIQSVKTSLTFSLIPLDMSLLTSAIFGGACFGLAALSFSVLSDSIKFYSNRMIKTKWLIPALGGTLIIALTLLVGTADYLGLGVSHPGNGTSIMASFNDGGAGYFSWFWKLLFTAVTLGTGFKGGEVTPLFFIGAALGNTIAAITGVPTDFMAALGFIAVFAGATNTPIASTIMGVELFGGEYLMYYAIACFTAFYFSGNTSIYRSQRKGFTKL